MPSPFAGTAGRKPRDASPCLMQLSSAIASLNLLLLPTLALAQEFIEALVARERLKDCHLEWVDRMAEQPNDALSVARAAQGMCKAEEEAFIAALGREVGIAKAREIFASRAAANLDNLAGVVVTLRARRGKSH